MENASTSMEDVLPPGTRLGPYEIGAPIGAGGMGVVYRARDPRLDRDVAIKLLPPFAAGDAEARARFEREARLIAQLQHPNVCALYDVGREGERDFLVMELLDGESLAQRLERGPLALTQLVTIGAAIADALAAAHRRGILHRDLKPGNVMLTRGGAKLLDFGLAKLHAPAVDARPMAEQETRLDSAISGAGTIAGTLVYMAPEQLEGKPLDARADIWGLGCVLYEMASGRRPFSGESAASTIASILQQEPPLLAELVPLTPPALEHLVRTCIAKDPEQRWQSAADLARELRWLGGSPSARSSAAGMAPVDNAGRPRRLARAALPWLGLAAGALLALAGFVVAARRPPAVARLPVRSTLPFVERRLDPFGAVPQISPDGRQVVVGSASSTWGEPLHLLALDSEEPRTLPGTEGAALPFWSPDGRSIAYFLDRRLYRIDLAQGTPTFLAKFDDDPRGGTWGAQGVLVISPGRTGGLVRVSAQGSEPVPLTELDSSRREVTHRFPVFLPGGERFLYWASANNSADDRLDSVRLASVDGKGSSVVLEKSYNAVYSAGHLLGAQAGIDGLLAWPFDAASGKVTGERRAIAHSVFSGYGISYLPVSSAENGDTVYVSEPTTWNTEIGWFDLTGKRVATLGPPSAYSAGRISPDGRSVAVGITDLTSFRTDVWVVDAGAGTRRRLTFGETHSIGPAWSPDGGRLAFVRQSSSGTASDPGIWSISALGGSSAELLWKTDRIDAPELDWSPDGRSIAFSVFDPERGRYALWMLDVATSKASAWLAGDTDASDPRFSPDGRFVAYQARPNGRGEVFLRRRDGSEQWQVTTEGGAGPRFGADGRTLYFVDRQGFLEAVALDLAATPKIGAGRRVGDQRLPVSAFFYFEVAPDGKRFLMDAPTPEAFDPRIRLLRDWQSLAKN